jgi:uncharacterized protein (TIGR00297 family)
VALPETSPQAAGVASLTPGELARKLVHIGVGGFALLLRYLSWPQAALMAVAAFLFNWQVLPRLGGRFLWRGEEQARGYPRGILVYPLSVLGLVLWFRGELWKVAAVWGLLAVGDGMASLLGLAAGGPRLPWNPRKGWVGLLAFVCFGTLAASALAAWTLRLPATALVSPRILVWSVPLAILAALVESVPTTLDDNFTVPLAGALALPLLVEAQPALLAAHPELALRILQGLAVNGAIAGLAFAARSIDVAGAVSAILIGTAITAGTGLQGLALMVGFFVIGSAVTKLGYRKKAERGIAQERGGARGWRNAWANGGIPAGLALLAGMAPDGARELLVVAYAAAVATAAADTCSSEIGKAYGRRTFLITSLKPVAPGTEGAVSLEGTLAGLAGGALVGALGWGFGLLGPAAAALVAVAGLLGSLAESLLGTVAERRGWLDNNLLNAVNTGIGAACAYGVAAAFPGLLT